MIRFGVVLLISATVLALMTVFACQQQWIPNLPSFFYQTLILLLFSTSTIFVYLFKVNKPGFFFIQLYLLTMVVKFIAYGAYNLLMIMEDRDGASLNVIFFMILYFTFTGVEIGFLYRKISNTEAS